jgi:pimeloyl-[acyl-carrier protein] methyl ester esterase
VSRLYAEVSGSGPPLVLLHGWGLNVRVWDGLAAALRDRFRIIAIDLPGHGRSAWLPERSSLEEQAEQVRETIADIAGEYSLLGWSLGGQIALQLAAGQDIPTARVQPAATWDATASRDPGAAPRMRRLVLIATTPRLVAGPDWPHGAPAERLAAQAAGLRSDYRRTVSDFLELQVRGSIGGAQALDQLRAALFAHGSDGRDDGPHLAALARGLELLRDTDLRPILSGITLPTLVIAGQYDRVTMPAASHSLADSLADAIYVEIRRAAHAPFLSHLPQLSALIADFLLQR